MKIPIETSLPAFCPPNKLWLLDPDDICSRAILKWIEINLWKIHAEATWIWKILWNWSPLTYAVKGRMVIELSYMLKNKVSRNANSDFKLTSALPGITSGCNFFPLLSRFSEQTKALRDFITKERNRIWVRNVCFCV